MPPSDLLSATLPVTPLPMMPLSVVFPAPATASVLMPAPVEPVMPPAMVSKLVVLALLSVKVCVVPSLPSTTAELMSSLVATVELSVTEPPLSSVSV